VIIKDDFNDNTKLFDNKNHSSFFDKILGGGVIEVLVKWKSKQPKLHFIL
jgi:hypothetical protein